MPKLKMQHLGTKAQRRCLTDFENKVYLAVSKIPRGEVRSYKWIAYKIGCPKAYRAVGNALNRNPYIGKVPCHRVIRSNGSIGGFAKGIKEKRKLLESELVDLISQY